MPWAVSGVGLPHVWEDHSDGFELKLWSAAAAPGCVAVVQPMLCYFGSGVGPTIAPQAEGEV